MKTIILSWPAGREEYIDETAALDRLLNLEDQGETVETCQIMRQGDYIRLEPWPKRSKKMNRDLVREAVDASLFVIGLALVIFIGFIILN
jgi:hypothetical protein